MTGLERDTAQAAVFADLAKNAPVTRRRLLLALMDQLESADKEAAVALIDRLEREGSGI